MKAYEIELTDYIIPGTEHLFRVEGDNVTPIMESGEQAKGALYPVKQNMVEVFMSLPTSGREILKSIKLGNKIENCKEDFVYLDNDEYALLKQSFEKFENFRPRADGEMAQRVLEAKEIEMKPKNIKEKKTWQQRKQK